MTDPTWPRFTVDLPNRGALACVAMTPFEAVALGDMKGEGTSDAQDNWIRIGFTIARTWQDAPEVQAETDAEIGHATVEALHAAGWRMPEMSALCLAITEQMNGSGEEEAREDFSEAQEGAAA
jgi:hypothetical protein